MNPTNPKIDLFINNTNKWQQELKKLRTIILDCGLTEELKWNVPVYTWQGKNIVGINGLKEFCAFSFFKGALLKDTYKILGRPGQVQAGRWMKFTGVDEIKKAESIIREYIFEAMEVEKANLKVVKKQTSDYKVPEEFQVKLNEFPELKVAYKALTPGRQRGYLFYFAQPKLSKTRAARIEKYIPKILKGKGLND
jgi:uncharacterized protein YdeI (YjbR/CyaY-like superfamily)